jgi:hypothetical protein
MLGFFKPGYILAFCESYWTGNSIPGITVVLMTRRFAGFLPNASMMILLSGRFVKRKSLWKSNAGDVIVPRTFSTVFPAFFS